MKCQIFKDVAYILKGFKKGDVSDLELNLITNIYMGKKLQISITFFYIFHLSFSYFSNKYKLSKIELKLIKLCKGREVLNLHKKL